jgi:lactobin A/cerein 7B family class IIb bacteriocin
MTNNEKNIFLVEKFSSLDDEQLLQTNGGFIPLIYLAGVGIGLGAGYVVARKFG